MCVHVCLCVREGGDGGWRGRGGYPRGVETNKSRCVSALTPCLSDEGQGMAGGGTK